MVDALASGQGATDSGTTATADSGTTVTTPVQGDASQQTTSNGPVTAEEETFFDPSILETNPDLKAAYKQMQSAFTKKMSSFKEHQAKLAEYDAFMLNPTESIKRMAQQYNVALNNAEGQEQASPESWDDVYKIMRGQLLQELQPLIHDVHNTKKQSIETQMDKDFPDWRLYEDSMTKLVQEHPSLAKNPSLLYKLAVPEDVQESRATKKALDKLKKQGDSSVISGGSTTTKTPSTGKKASSFQEAYEQAMNSPEVLKLKR